MSNNISRFLTWFPRVLAVAFALFISVFALDAWGNGDAVLTELGHTLLHLIPTAAVLAALGLAWHRRIIGGLVFMILGMVFTIHFGTWRTAQLFMLFSLPLFVAGVGFIFSRYSQITPKH